MRIVKSAVTMQRLAQSWQREGVSVTLVPTMGSLHAGHISLVKRARTLAGPRGKVVVSIFVNPTQFGPQEDFNRYPRDLAGDTRICRASGVDVVFAPGRQEIYPDGFSTYIEEESLSRTMEGASRPGHFRGVATVVVKLFNIVQPAFAVFGAKDWQQAAVVRRVVRDLNMPLKIVVAPIFREPDGLAMSSRNQYLKGATRASATVLWRALLRARKAVGESARPLRASNLKADLRRFIEREPGARADYVEFFEPHTMVASTTVRHGTHMALAVRFGGTRLIDNARI